MDLVYIAGPGLMAAFFAFLAANTNPKENPLVRNMFFFASLLALTAFLGLTQQVSLAGELVPDTELASYNYNATGTLMNITTTHNYTRNSPLVAKDFDNTWILGSVVIQLVFYLSFILLLWSALSWFANAMLTGRQKKEEEA